MRLLLVAVVGAIGGAIALPGERTLLPWDDDHPALSTGLYDICPATGCCVDYATCHQRKYLMMAADAYVSDENGDADDECKMPYIVPDGDSVDEDVRRCITITVDYDGVFSWASEGKDRVVVCKDGHNGNNLDDDNEDSSEEELTNEGRWCWVAFHGIDDNSDWLTGFFGSLDYVTWLDQYRVLRGFRSEYRSIGAKAIEALKNLGCLNEAVGLVGQEGIHITGHSLGGAMAQMLYTDLITTYGEWRSVRASTIRVTTYGSARAFKKNSAPEVREGDWFRHYYTGAVHQRKRWGITTYQFKEDAVRDLQSGKIELVAAEETYLLCHYYDRNEGEEFNHIYQDKSGTCLDHHIPGNSFSTLHLSLVDSSNLHDLGWYDYVLDKADQFGC